MKSDLFRLLKYLHETTLTGPLLYIILAAQKHFNTDDEIEAVIRIKWHFLPTEVPEEPLKCSITNERLAAAGYFSILNYYESLHLCG